MLRYSERWIEKIQWMINSENIVDDGLSIMDSKDRVNDRYRGRND